MYKRIVTRFGILLEMVSDNEPQFTSDVWEDLMERLAIKHRLTTMYKPSTNGLVERTNKMLCSIIAKEAETKTDANGWDLKIHHAMWVYNSTFKMATGFSPFCLAYGIEALLPIEYELMTLRTAIKTRLDLDESQQRQLVQFNELDEVQLRAREAIEVAQTKMKKVWNGKVKKRVFKIGDLVMMYDSRHFRRAHKKLLPKWFGLYEIKEVFTTNGTYSLRNLDGTNYPDQVNHDKLKKAYVDLLD